MNRLLAGFGARDLVEWGVFLLFFGIVTPLMGSEYWVYLSTEIMIWGFFAIAWNLLFGITGMLSFGQAAFFGLGAYGYALLILKGGLPILPAVLLALLIAPLVALILAPICVRMKEVYFALMTMAFGQLLWAITFKWYGFTGGDNGLQGIPAPAVMDNPTAAYYVVFAVVLVGMILIWFIRNSAFGRVLTGINQNDERAAFLGLNVRRYQLAVFVISGFFCGAAGIAFAMFQRSIHPMIMHWSTSGDVVLMTILGGFPTFFGSMLGGMIIVLLRDFVSAYTEYWSIFVGFVILICVVVTPKGILGSLHNYWPNRRLL